MNLRLPHVNGRTHRFAPTIIVILFAIFILFAPRVWAVSVDAVDISNRKYYDAVIQELNTAQDSIYAAMYSMYLRDNADSATYKLITALCEAHKRGVAVKVYLDANKGNAKGNLAAYEMLKKAGVAVYFIDPKIKMHAKVILIDNSVVVTGSANWTETAVSLNTEHNVILRSKEFAQGQLAFFKELEDKERGDK